ncbi:TRAP transporter small permease [Sporosarcina cascadiensis]|uniref:TRAP transporter small permease n=1 Tax=Sporosarcina cascadiensis TaxID=2660747 RepID=UPI00129A5900|nr:TRAP transporter small permease [Sporosarcina cascadiensis]
MNKIETNIEPKFIIVVERIMKKINNVFIALAAVMIMALVIIIVQEVIRRYFFNQPSTWALDISRFLLVYVFFLSLAPALQSGAHVSTDMVTSKLSPTMQWICKQIAYCLTIIYGIILFWQVLMPTIQVFSNNRIFPIVIEVPMKYVYVIAPIGTAQFVITSIICLILTFYRERILLKNLNKSI